MNFGWKANPSNPGSSDRLGAMDIVLSEISNKVLFLGADSGDNSEITPPFSTTNNRVSSPGRLTMATGRSNLMPGKASLI